MVQPLPTLDRDALEAFVRVADLRSVTRAAETLGTTQFAVSLEVKRLEASVGRRLLECCADSRRASGERPRSIRRGPSA